MTTQAVSSAVNSAIHKSESEDQFTDHRRRLIRKGTHRFDIHPGQLIFSNPKVSFVNREQDRAERMAMNAANIKKWERRYAVVTPDAIEVRGY